MTPFKIFISYSHNAKDRPLLDQLLRHIAPLVQTGQMTIWEDSQIIPGGNWEQAISENIRTAHIILLLVSSDYLASDYVNNIEVPIAIQRQAAGECTVVPVLLRSCVFELMPYAGYEFLPKTAGDQRLVPLDLWENKDDAFAAIVRRLNRLTQSVDDPNQSDVALPVRPNAIVHSDMERQGYEQQLQLATQKRQRLETALLLETDPSRQFALEHEIQKIHTTVDDLKSKLRI